MNQVEYNALINTWDGFKTNSIDWTQLRIKNEWFVFDIGDAKEYGIEIKKTYAGPLIALINKELRNNGLSTIKAYSTKSQLKHQLSYICSRDFRFVHQLDHPSYDVIVSN